MESQKRQMKPYVRIIEQPKSKAVKFSTKHENESCGSGGSNVNGNGNGNGSGSGHGGAIINCIQGEHSTMDKKTYPTIEIVGYKGEAIVVVSCVTESEPYRPHPNSLIGNKACKKGVCTVKINTDTMKAVFNDLKIKCENDIEQSLKIREGIRVDPFKTGFAHRFQSHNINVNVVRLCFQVIIEGHKKGCFTKVLEPVVTEPIYNLVICRLANYRSSVMGNSEVTLLCGKIAKDDISVRFYEEQNNQIVWEAIAKIDQTDVHNETAIILKTPTYHTLTITEPVQVYIQLKQPSDGSTSAPLSFEYLPLSMETKYLINQHESYHHCYNHFLHRRKTAIYPSEPNNSTLFTKFIDESNASVELFHASDLTVRAASVLPTIMETTTNQFNNSKVTTRKSDLNNQHPTTHLCNVLESNEKHTIMADGSGNKMKHSNCDCTAVTIVQQTPLKEQHQRELVPRLLQSF